MEFLEETHLIPKGDLHYHLAARFCECEPFVKNGLWTHRRYDSMVYKEVEVESRLDADNSM